MAKYSSEKKGKRFSVRIYQILPENLWDSAVLSHPEVRNVISLSTILRIKGHEMPVRLQVLILAIASINSSKNSLVWEYFFPREENYFL